MTGEFEVLGMAAAGYVTAPNGLALETQNIVTNCPIVHRYAWARFLALNRLLTECTDSCKVLALTDCRACRIEISKQF